MNGWALYSSQDGEQSFQGNEGYDDNLGVFLSYDTQVANSRQVKKGDRILIMDSKLVYGVSVVEDIDAKPAKKQMNVCPDCGTATVSSRKLLPGWRCGTCKKIWPAPKVIQASVTAFRAHYSRQWRPFAPPVPRNSIIIPFTNSAVQNAIRPIDWDLMPAPLVASLEIAEIEDAINLVAGKPRSGGGFAPHFSSAQKKAIETRAMEVSRQYLEAHGWTVEDTSSGNPFDFRARRNSEELHVEVKGTSSTGESVVLTRGEVNHHSTPRRQLHLCIGDNYTRASGVAPNR